MLKRFLLLVLAILICASSAFAAGVPTNPFGATNSTPNLGTQVILDYFKQPAHGFKDYDLPTFTRPDWSSVEGGVIGRATSHEDLIAYLSALPRTNMQMRFVGEIFTYVTDNNTPADMGMPIRSFKFPICVFTKEGVFDPADVKALGRPVVLIEGSIHGGEISATESMLAIAKRLAMGDLNSLLDKVTVIVIPRYNVDGVYKRQRGTDSIQPWHYGANVSNALNQTGTPSRLSGVDQNRDNTGFESPIVRLIHVIWNAYEPHYIGDGHEMGATTGTASWNHFGIGTLFTSNPNTPEELDILAHDGITIKAVPNDPATWETADSLEHLVKRALREKGLEWWYYLGTGYGGNRTGPNPFEYHNGTAWVAPGAVTNYVLANNGNQEGNPEEGITDSAGRIKGAFGFLGEATTIGGTMNYHRRIHAHEVVYETIIKAFADPVRGPILKSAVDNARKAMAEGTSVRTDVRPQDLVIALQNGDPISVDQVILGEKGIPVLRLVRNPNNPADPTPVVSTDYLPARVSRSRHVIALPEADRPHSTVLRPTAYIINCDDDTAARITYTGVRIERLAEPVSVPVEYYTVTSFDANVNFRGAYNVTVSQLSTGISAVDKGTKTMSFPKDTYVIFMDQYNSVHASLTVEPSGGRNFGNYWFNRAAHSKKGFLPVALGEDYPAYRYMGDAAALKTYFAGDISMLPFVTDTNLEWPLMLTQEQKAGYVNKVLSAKTELVDFSAFTVNHFAGEFRVYLKKTHKPGDWYAWNWATGEGQAISAANDGFAALNADNIGSNNEVVLICVGSILPCGDPALLPENGVTVESSSSGGFLTVAINNSGLTNGEQVKFYFIESKDNFFEIAKAVTLTGSGKIEAYFSDAELLALGLKDGTEYAIQYSNASGDVVGYGTYKSGGFRFVEYKGPGTGGSGCSAGFAAFALLMLIPFALKKKD